MSEICECGTLIYNNIHNYDLYCKSIKNNSLKYKNKRCLNCHIIPNMIYPSGHIQGCRNAPGYCKICFYHKTDSCKSGHNNTCIYNE
jgi:hypothetical protein